MLQVPMAKLGVMQASVDSSITDRFLAFFTWAVSAAKAAGETVSSEVDVFALTTLIEQTSPKDRVTISKAIIEHASTLFPDARFGNWVVMLLNMELALYPG